MNDIIEKKEWINPEIIDLDVERTTKDVHSKEISSTDGPS